MTEERLIPARPPEREKGPFAVSFLPWKWVLAGLVVIAGAISIYVIRDRQEAARMRSEILSVFDEQLAPAVTRHAEFRSKLEAWIKSAGETAPESWIDPGLQLSSLNSRQGLYLRIRDQDTVSPERISNGARAMSRDAITSCLGIAPASLAGLYEHGEFLMPAFREDVRQETSTARLAVLQTALNNHLEHNFPAVANLMQAEYFLLAVQRGASRRTHPVDFYMWDLRSGEQVLRTRTRAEGRLLTIPIYQPGGRYHTPPPPDSPGADDCSLAAQLKELAGQPAITVVSEIPDLSAPDEPTQETPTTMNSPEDPAPPPIPEP